MKYLPLAGVLVLTLTGAAGAATMSPAQTSNTPAYAAPVIADANAMKAADAMPHANLRQQLQDQLSKAGYTGVKIMPSSFYVQAKDKKGEPVAMVIGPDSFVEVTETKSAQPMPQASAQPNVNEKK